MGNAIETFHRVLETVSRDNCARYMKNHFPEQYKEILEKTVLLDQYDVPDDKNRRISIFERVYCIEHGLSNRPLCKACGKNHVCGFDKVKNEYRKWCCPRCQASDKSCVKKSKNTRLSRYGTENYNGIEKSRETRKERYGSWHDDGFAAKVKHTKLERYGDENHVNIDKCRKTKLERYGDENYANLEKMRETKKDRYGDENWNNRDKFKETLDSFPDERRIEIKNKRNQTNIERYGVEYPMQSAEVKHKASETNMSRYGVTSSLQIPHVRDVAIRTKKERSWEFLSKESEYQSMFTKEEYLDNRDPDKRWLWRHTTCGNVFSSRYDNGQHGRCPECYPPTRFGTSEMELEVAEFVRTITDNKVYHREPENRRLLKDREIDILIPSLRIGIEFDGLYYHSETSGVKSPKYHLEKTEMCKALGYRLIHIFEDEWTMKRRIVESRLRSILSSHRRRVFARKCTISEIDNETKDSFLEKYHIQGRDTSSIRLGLFYHGRMVACMTFVKPRFSKAYDYELSRYATISHFTIVGGAGKLLKHFERNHTPRSIVTYADRRWSVGNLYNRLGFVMTHKSTPAYFYVKRGIRYSRMSFQKHRLKNILPIFDEHLTEVQNMRNNGYDRIFDCGNLVFVKNYA